MTVPRANLRRLLAPNSIALIGGRQARAAAGVCRSAGFAGDLFIVNQRGEGVDGAEVVADIGDLPKDLDAAFVGLSAAATPDALAELSAAGVGGAVVYADGFADMAELQKAAGDMALVGPNCFGLINCITGGSLWPSPHPLPRHDRGVAILAQSGNACINIANGQRALPYSYIVSLGNQAVIGMADFIDLLVDDPAVTAIGLFMEGIADVDAFAAAAAKARAVGKPIVACKVGRSPLGAQLAMSHTATLAGADRLYDALFERLAIACVDSVPELLECLKLATMWPAKPDRGLAIVSTSGGDCELAADHAAKAGLDLPALSRGQSDRLAELLPPVANVANPLDYSAQLWGDEAALTPVFTEMFREGYDAGLLIIEYPTLAKDAPAFATAARATHRALMAARDATGVEVALTSVLPESLPLAVQDDLVANGVVPLQGLDTALAAMGALNARDLAQAALTNTPTPAVMRSVTGGSAVQTLDEWQSKQILADFGVPVPRGELLQIGEAPSPDLSYPVAVKAVHSDLPHKTEAGAVMLDVPDTAAVAAAMEKIQDNVSDHDSEIGVDRFLVEPMVADAVAELIVGLHRDPIFGLTMTIGAGGILVELLDDAVSVLLPADAAQFGYALRKLQCFELMHGFRGRLLGDLEALIEALMTIARFADAWSDRLEELDINPLFVRPVGVGVMAGDALIRARS